MTHSFYLFKLVGRPELSFLEFLVDVSFCCVVEGYVMERRLTLFQPPCRLARRILEHSLILSFSEWTDSTPHHRRAIHRF